ncbi:glycosyltransferase [Microbacterium phage TinyMiny]|nr:glycosyltransferase [Microbacterium phage TinyMiny]
MSRVVALIPAHNEAGSIAVTIEAILDQERVPDLVVVIPNGCSDNTAEIARNFPVKVLELPRLAHRKSQALNTAWRLFAEDADVVICLDADTFLPRNAVGDWEVEMAENPEIGGSSSKFTMQGPGLLTRLQKAEFSAWTDTALRKGDTHVLAGTGCAIRGSVLREVAARDDREGPWCYTSATEDFELTYRIRELGYRCQVSPTVRAYTDSMDTIKALWGQRMKWQVGTVEDLLYFGVNRLTLRDWGQQAMGIFGAFLKMLWLYVIIGQWVVFGQLNVYWVWWLLPLLFIALDVKRATRIPHRDWKDIVIAASFFPNEVFMWLRSAWFTRSWIDVLFSKVTGKRPDRWAAQYKAEGMEVK